MAKLYRPDEAEKIAQLMSNMTGFKVTAKMVQLENCTDNLIMYSACLDDKIQILLSESPKNPADTRSVSIIHC